MGKNIIFLPFINGKEGKDWRDNLQKNFLQLDDVKKLNDIINNKRGNKPQADKYGDTKSEKERYETDTTAYLNELRVEKAVRQTKWLQYLLKETADQIRVRLADIPNTDEHKNDTIVAALPEFFWYDINDNDNHLADDPHYHKPIYENTMYGSLWDRSNALAQLTSERRNLIIFAGTVLWKKINQSDHRKDKIYNSMLVYFGGKLGTVWTKYHTSNIDGLSLPEKYEKVEKERSVLVPYIEFNNLRFTYDICLDFKMGDGNQPLSTTLCAKENKKTDVNVLIAAGMTLDKCDMDHINSPIVLRCDGLNPPYAEIAPRGKYDSKNSKILSDGKIIGMLQTDINV